MFRPGQFESALPKPVDTDKIRRETVERIAVFLELLSDGMALEISDTRRYQVRGSEVNGIPRALAQHIRKAFGGG